ncbi:hypothetical protein RR11_644 [Ruegeria sp. R11]|nr:hypothetical protein RR11_644 [Ruegeria sp. R11]
MLGELLRKTAAITSAGLGANILQQADRQNMSDNQCDLANQ